MAVVLVFIPGSFGESHWYDPLVAPLREKGFQVDILDPPCYPRSYKKGSPLPSMYDDAAFIAKHITGLIDNGSDVVIASHSYGGIPASECLKGLTKEEREEEGKQGGVVRAAYITTVVPIVGEGLMQTIKGGVSQAIVPDEEGWLQHADPAGTAKIINHMDHGEATKFVASWGRHSGRSFADPLTHAGYKDLPVSWFFCEDDLCVTPEVQQTAVDVIEASWKGTAREGNKVDVKKVWADHIPNFSAKEELASWLEGLLK